MRNFFLLGLFLLAGNVLAETSLWQVSKGDSKLLLGGTVHVLSASDYPLPGLFEEAYRQSSRLVLETDMEAINSPAFQQKMMMAMAYSDGRTLRSELSASTYQILEKYAASVQFPLDSFQHFKPTMVSLVLTVYELGRLGMAETGVDGYFAERAMADGKPLGQLETAEQQLSYIASMGLGQEDELILSTVSDMQALPEMMTALKSAWRRGDNKALAQLGIVPMQDEFPELYQNLLVERNKRWMPQIEALLQTQETELILVGALHLAGDDGLLRQLSKRGYSVQFFSMQ